MSHLDPIAYTYEADVHCVGDALERFGADANGFVPAGAVDAEGNEPGALFPWQEWQNFYGGREVLACGTCGGTIDEYDGDEG